MRGSITSTTLLAAALVVGCGDPREGDRAVLPLPDVGGGEQSAPFGGARPNAPVPAVPAVEPLTAYGREPVRVGMDEREALAALGLEPPPAGGVRERCRVVRPARGPAGLYVMIEDGRVARVSVEGEGPVKTREGLRVGSTAAQVRAIYGDQLTAAPHDYVRGGESLTWWADQGAAGLRFETDAQGRVTALHGGGPAIAYSEGCS